MSGNRSVYCSSEAFIFHPYCCLTRTSARLIMIPGLVSVRSAFLEGDLSSVSAMVLGSGFV